MGRVVASYKIFPSDIEVKLDSLKESIKQALPSEASIHSFQDDPIAFGLTALIANIIMPEDVEGEIDKIEEILRKIDTISEIQTLMVRRI